MLARNTQLPGGAELPRRRLLAALRAGGRATRSSTAASSSPPTTARRYTDHGKLQALFEYASLIGELVELDAVSQPTYDWATAAATRDLHGGPRHRPAAARSCRPRSRPERLVGDRAATAGRGSTLERVPFDAGDRPARPRRAAGGARRRRGVRLRREPRLSSGRSRRRPRQIAERWRTTRARSLVVGVDPISLGVLEAPPRYGADIVCGELQPLGVHMHYGGGLAGFVATPDEERCVAEYPTFLIGIDADRRRGRVRLRRGRLGAHVLRPARRRQASTRGTTQNLWAIAVGGLPVAARAAGHARSSGEGLHAAGALRRRSASAELAGRRRRRRSPAPFFKELVVVVRRHRQDGRRGQPRAAASTASSAAATSPGSSRSWARARSYCVTEVHTQADIDRLVDALAEVLPMSEHGATRLRPFHQASWNEPIVLEQSSPGERGFVPPPSSPSSTGRGRRRRSPTCPQALRRPTPPALPELSQPQVLRHFLRLSQETLGERRRHPPRASARAR